MLRVMNNVELDYILEEILTFLVYKVELYDPIRISKFVLIALLTL